MNFLIDYNLTGSAVLFRGTLADEGWLELLSINLFTFEDVGLPMDSDDRSVWRFVQNHMMILMTANRNMKGSDSLESIIRQENSNISFPILTIGNPDRIDERKYREQCVTRLIEIVLDIKNYMGAGRLFIP